MAQTNFTPILLYASSTAAAVPSAANLTNSATGSEIAINVADKNLFFKDSTNAVNTVPIRQSSTSSNGWLSSTDWSTFNGKQAALVSGTNIKTVSGVTLLGSGDVGTIGVGYGGTGITTTPSNGQIPIGNGTNYTAAAITAGSGISVTNASGSITVANTQNTGPTFSASSNANLTVSSGVTTKIKFQVEAWDTAAAYDNVTNFRFTPLVAGYYQVNAEVECFCASYFTGALFYIYKNGSSYKRTQGFNTISAATLLSEIYTQGSCLVYLNGSTDYIEVYLDVTTVGAVNATVYAGGDYTWFQAALVRTA